MDVTFTNEPEDKLNDKRLGVRRLFIGLAWGVTQPYQNSVPIGQKVQLLAIVFETSAFIYAIIKGQTPQKLHLTWSNRVYLLTLESIGCLPNYLWKIKVQIQPISHKHRAETRNFSNFINTQKKKRREFTKHIKTKKLQLLNLYLLFCMINKYLIIHFAEDNSLQQWTRQRGQSKQKEAQTEIQNILKKTWKRYKVKGVILKYGTD